MSHPTNEGVIYMRGGGIYIGGGILTIIAIVIILMWLL